MTFAVKPSALDNFAATLSGSGSNLSSEYSSDYANYVHENIKVDGGGLVISMLTGKIASISQSLSSEAPKISKLLDESASGLRDSATLYRETDRTVSARMDAIYKTSSGEQLDDSVPPTPVLSPREKLTEPGDDGVVPDLAQELLDAGGVFSETDLVLKILRMCGLDIIGWAADHLAGDFKSIARCKNALENLSKFDGAAANVVTTGGERMFDHWTGNAATAAQSFFARTADGLNEHATSIDGVVSRMDALIIGIQEGLAALEGALTTALDMAVEAAAAVAAAGCLQAIPGIDILSDIVGAAEVTRLVLKVKDFFDIWNKIWAGAEGIVGMIMALEGGLSSWSVDAALPKMAYSNAAQ